MESLTILSNTAGHLIALQTPEVARYATYLPILILLIFVLVCVATRRWFAARFAFAMLCIPVGIALVVHDGPAYQITVDAATGTVEWHSPRANRSKARPQQYGRIRWKLPMSSPIEMAAASLFF